VFCVIPDGVVSGGFQGFGAVGADDLTTKSGIDQVRDPADMIDVGMGEKQKAGDAGFSAEMGDGDVTWGHQYVDGCWVLKRAYITVGPDSVQIKKRQFQF
jgi:hypothetical protein